MLELGHPFHIPPPHQCFWFLSFGLETYTFGSFNFLRTLGLNWNYMTSSWTSSLQVAGQIIGLLSLHNCVSQFLSKILSPPTPPITSVSLENSNRHYFTTLAVAAAGLIVILEHRGHSLCGYIFRRLRRPHCDCGHRGNWQRCLKPSSERSYRPVMANL